LRRGDIRDTNATVKCQPLLRQSQEDINTTTEAREKEERGRGMQEIRSGGVVEDRTQPVEEVRTATPSNSPKRTKKEKENREYRGTVART